MIITSDKTRINDKKCVDYVILRVIMSAITKLDKHWPKSIQLNWAIRLERPDALLTRMRIYSIQNQNKLFELFVQGDQLYLTRFPANACNTFDIADPNFVNDVVDHMLTGVSVRVGDIAKITEHDF